MKEDLMEVVAILDMSGSMYSIANDTIGGFNAYLDELRDCEGPITSDIYKPTGGTALTDAMGASIDRMKYFVSRLPEERKPGRVYFFVTTDGEENSSRSYNNEYVKKLVEQLTDEDKWTFTFAGANIDAFAAGAKLGFYAINVAYIHADAMGYRGVYAAIANRYKMAMNCPMSMMSAAPVAFYVEYEHARIKFDKK